MTRAWIFRRLWKSRNEKITVLSTEELADVDMADMSALTNFRKYLAGNATVKNFRSVFPTVRYLDYICISTVVQINMGCCLKEYLVRTIPPRRGIYRARTIRPFAAERYKRLAVNRGISPAHFNNVLEYRGLRFCKNSSYFGIARIGIGSNWI